MTDQTELPVEIEAGSVEVFERPAMPDVAHLMEVALQHGEGGVAALERLVGLQEHMMRVQAENALAHALAQFQAECPMIQQSKTASIATKSGGSYSFTYAPLDVIARTIRPHLKKHGLSYAFDSTLEGIMLTVTCKVRHADGASVEGTFTATTESKSGASATQKQGGAHTYGKRQALASALGLITTNADSDAMGEAVDSKPIGESDLRKIRALIKTKGADVDKLLAYVGVFSLADIPASSFGMVIRTLEAKADA